jgi:uncharacterized protein YbaP (TraB family)
MAGVPAASRRARWTRLFIGGAVLALITGAAAAEATRSLLPAVASPSLAGAPAARALCPPALPQASPAEQAAAPRDRGLLWRATRDGRVLHLYGTLHVGKPHWKKLGPRTSAALRDSDVLALEIDPLDPALGAAMAELPYPRQFSAAMRERLDLAFRRACMAPEALAALHPLLQLTTLTVMEARWFGMDPAYSAELTLAAQPRNGSRKLVALETPALQIRALVPAEETEAQAMFEQGLEQLENESARRVLQKLATAWEKGDLATLEDTRAWCECQLNDTDRALMARLTEARNAALAAGIVAQHRAGKRVFAAVGALHMAGPQSLPRLLEQQGFKVERIRF